MNKDIPLVVPSLHNQALAGHKIIASPNCVAIQLSIALKPILDYIREDFLVITTLQSVSGSGKQALEELERQSPTSSVYPFGVHDNVLYQCGDFVGDHTDEEIKIMQETSKILNCDLNIQVTSLRVPITRGHHLSVTCFLKDWHHQREDLEHFWSRDSRIKVCSTSSFPHRAALVDSSDVYISRIRLKDRALSFMVSADNLYVGAAYNAWDIFNQRCLELDIANSQIAI